MKYFKLGKSKSTGEVVDVKNAKNGLSCDCVCFDCGANLEAHQGQKNEWHFKHHEETDCNGGQETALHILANKILVENTEINLPKYGKIVYDNAIEKKPLDSFIPDVTAITNGKNIYFEVFVTHQVEEAKENYFRKGEHKSIEINLRNYTFTSIEELENEVLENDENKRIIFWEKEPVTQKEDNSLFYFICGVAVFLLLREIWKLFFPKRKYRKSYTF